MSARSVQVDLCQFDDVCVAYSALIPDFILSFIARENRGQFTAEFLAYLPENLHVYRAFEREALRVIARGREHYSARTIVEVLRHESALAQADGTFKLNDRFTPALARLFALKNPSHRDLFEFREAKSVTRQERVAA